MKPEKRHFFKKVVSLKLNVVEFTPVTTFFIGFWKQRRNNIKDLRSDWTSSWCSVSERTTAACTAGTYCSSFSSYCSYFFCTLRDIFPPRPLLRPPRVPRLRRAGWVRLGGRRAENKPARRFGCSRRVGPAAVGPRLVSGLPGPAARTGRL